MVPESNEQNRRPIEGNEGTGVALERLIESALGGTRIGLLAMDREFKIFWATNLIIPEEQFEYGKSAEDFFDGKSVESLNALKRRVLESGERQSGELELKFGDETRYILITYNPLHDEEGEIVALTGATVDITERRQMELVLKTSEERFRILAENASDVIIECDAQGVIRYVSPACREVLHCRGEELTGRTFVELLMKEAQPRIGERLVDRIAQGRRDRFEFQFQTPEGRMIWLEATMQRFRRHENVSYFNSILILRDITGRKALDQRRERFEAMAIDLTCILNKQGRLLYASPAWIVSRGMHPRDLINRKLTDWIHPEDRERFRQALDELAGAETHVHVECRIQTVGEQYQWLRWSMKSYPEEEVIYGLARDIEELKETREQLEGQARHERVLSFLSDQALTELAMDAFFRETLEIVRDTLKVDFCKITQIQAGGKALVVRAGLGWKQMETASQPLHRDGLDQLAYEEDRNIAIENVGEHPRLMKDNLLSHHEIGGGLSVPIREGGKIFGFLSVFDRAPRRFGEEEVEFLEDVAVMLGSALERLLRHAEIKEHRDELSELVASHTRALEIANEELGQFNEIVTHDLRAPLRAIDNYARFLSENLAGQLDAQSAEYLEGLCRAVRQGQELVSDLLIFSRIGRGGLTPIRIDPPSFLEEAVDSLKLTVSFELHLKQDHWPRLTIEPVLLRQIFQNLILNGIKFNRSERKIIEIDWRRSEEGELILEILDNGIGIPMAQRERIFKVFERLHTTDEYEGSGIGLAIVQKAVRLLGGEIEAAARAESAGSRFTIRLPERVVEQWPT